ncbi:hypothetical protein [Paenibacillus graminis]|uniref:hypothetical protein n=1 Tax=Paenibacillus graminis TaxID=189425 RepID=UPI002DBCF62B|nr:hypothetical protein [Paenibacillus graminis]MEC0169930.1 hypothetical protein [Paenibacillus graminis]
MRVILQDMTIEGSADELLNFLNLKEEMNSKNVPLRVKDIRDDMVGTCVTKKIAIER